MKKAKQLIVLRVLLVAMIMCCLPLQVSAETIYIGTKLNTDYVLVFTPYEEFGATTISHFNEALSRWNFAAGITLMRREPTLRHNKTDYPSNDNKHYIYKMYDSRAYAGATAYYTSFLSNVLKSVDININPFHRFANSQKAGCFDLWSIFMHEAGHAAGLNELTEESHSGCVMYYLLDEGQIKREITAYDGANIRGLYS